MDHFASALFVTGLRAELDAAGVPTAAVPTRGARVAADAKRRLLLDVAATHGVRPLLAAGAALVGHVPQPALSALLAATSARDLLARWSRLERFLHSGHRVLVRRTTPTSVRADHVAVAGPPPVPAEDAVVLGLLTGLFGALGAQDLVVRTGADGGRRVYADGGFRDDPEESDAARWHFAWSTWRRRGPRPGPERADLVDRVRDLVAHDLGHRWSVDAAAAELGLTRRTLQRRLATHGGLSGLTAAARTAAAAELLIATEHPLAVVGFACGYADQPHLTREFTHRSGMTPAAYRSAFALPAMAVGTAR